jgi:hypothetical protein
MTETSEKDVGFFQRIVGDGRPLLIATAMALLFSGGFAIFLAAAGEFLPHDIAYLGLSARDLCALRGCRIVDFMIHDRAAFGGAVVGIGVLYLWLTLFPLRSGHAWAWWTLVISGVIGFASFLFYLGYGYLDTWHGIGTLLLLPVFALGMIRTRRILHEPCGPGRLLQPGATLSLGSRSDVGRAVLMAGAVGTIAGGLSITWVGITDIFVPEDLEFMGTTAAELRHLSDRLVPLMAHDRAGFGGAVLTMGITTLCCLWCAPPSRSLWEAILAAGGVSLSAAIGVHAVVGYTDIWHLMPALAAALSLVVGLYLTAPVSRRQRQRNSARNLSRHLA